MTPPYLSRNYDQNNMNFHLTRSLLSSFKDRVSTNTKLVRTFVRVIRCSLESLLFVTNLYWLMILQLALADLLLLLLSLLPRRTRGPQAPSREG